MKYELNDFIDDVFRIAHQQGYRTETNVRNNLPQIDFGIKKLHLDHIKKLYPDVLREGAKINKLIDKVAPGRPCSHKPFREIIDQIKNERPNKLLV